MSMRIPKMPEVIKCNTVLHKAHRWAHRFQHQHDQLLTFRSCDQCAILALDPWVTLTFGTLRSRSLFAAFGLSLFLPLLPFLFLLFLLGSGRLENKDQVCRYVCFYSPSLCSFWGQEGWEIKTKSVYLSFYSPFFPFFLMRSGRLENKDHECTLFIIILS